MDRVDDNVIFLKIRIDWLKMTCFTITAKCDSTYEFNLRQHVNVITDYDLDNSARIKVSYSRDYRWLF